jgi:hypothetical protein
MDDPKDTQIATISINFPPYPRHLLKPTMIPAHYHEQLKPRCTYDEAESMQP